MKTYKKIYDRTRFALGYGMLGGTTAYIGGKLPGVMGTTVTTVGTSMVNTTPMVTNVLGAATVLDLTKELSPKKLKRRKY